MKNRFRLSMFIFILFIGINPIPAFSNISPNLVCLATQCTKSFGACAFEINCILGLRCTADCKFTDPDENQRCLIGCIESNPSSRYDPLVSCMLERECMVKSPPRFCAKPQNKAQIAPTTLADLQGDWFVIRGLSRAYDCWPGQKMSFYNLKESISNYDYEYQVGKQKSQFHCSVKDLPDPSPGRFVVNYKVHGMEGSDDWYVLSQPNPDYALIYYCGTTAIDQYRGAIVMSKKPDLELPQSVLQAFDQALQYADLKTPVSMTEFCRPEVVPIFP